MPDNLRISNPVPTNDGINRMTPPKQAESSIPIDPSKVVQPNTDKQQNSNLNFDLLLNRTSVFNKFLDQLRQTPELTQTLQKIVFDAFTRAEKIHDNKPTTLLLKQLSAAIKMDSAEDILKNINFQDANKTKFSGPIFDIFRNLLNEHPSHEFKLHLADFLKAYDGYFSIPDTTLEIKRVLNALIKQIPKTYGKQLEELSEQLLTEQPVNSLDLNLNLLKEKIIPLLSEYVTATNDYGLARDTITLLIHNIARLNISSHQEVVDTFSSLLDYCKYNLNLPQEKMNIIKSMFLKSVSDSSKTPENKLFDSIVKLFSENLKNSTSNVSQSLFKDTINSLLLDNSVYMPFTHIFLPVNYNGQFMFSEIWIEKNDEASKKDTLSYEENPVHIFLNFEIKQLGCFEASIVLTGNNINLELNCPSSLSREQNKISKSISEILSSNGFNSEHIKLNTDNSKRTADLITKKIYERKNVIDVSV